MHPLMRTRSSSSTSSTSSACSLSLSPTGWNPSRPTISPPSTTTSTSSSPENDYFATTTSRQTGSKRRSSLSPPTSIPATTTHYTCAYPSWPQRSSLSTSVVDMATPASPSSAHHPSSNYGLPSSRISDEDLEDLDFSSPGLDVNALGDGVGLGISWSAVGGANVEMGVPRERRRRLPPPPAMNVRRRSSSRGTKRKGKAGMLGVINE